MKTRKLFLACACALFALAAQAQTQVIAHRGFWKAEGSAQNSITALKKAAEAQVYGSEFDVQLTKDGIVVVNHDDTIGGYTIAETDYATLKDLKLKNGETLPTLEDYLKAGKQLPDIQLILEIKPHKTEAQENRISADCVKMVKEMGMEKQVEYISFSMHVCEQLVKLTPGSEIAYLKSDIAPKDIKAKGMTGIDYYYKVFDKHPEWVKEAHDLGMKVNAWTVDETTDMQKLIDLKVDYLTTDQPLEAKELVK
ncbi:glycerophosphoryl diester phosphodiesterase [Bacteroides sp. CAG:702]|nr:glycerophosphoryl diester phosphodiesterase [Bacteroides sp. CAG:702]